MKRTLLTIALLTLFTFGSETQAEIKNKKVLMEIFVGCVEEDLQDIDAGSQIDYCGCVTKGVSVGMTVKEVMRLGLDMTAAGKDKELEVIAANDKLADYIAECAVKLYE